MARMEVLPFSWNERFGCDVELADPGSVYRQARDHFCHLHNIERHLRMASIYKYLVAYVPGSLLLGQYLAFADPFEKLPLN